MYYWYVLFAKNGSSEHPEADLCGMGGLHPAVCSNGGARDAGAVKAPKIRPGCDNRTKKDSLLLPYVPIHEELFRLLVCAEEYETTDTNPHDARLDPRK